jgi:hypothetical protein
VAENNFQVLGAAVVWALDHHVNEIAKPNMGPSEKKNVERLEKMSFSLNYSPGSGGGV